MADVKTRADLQNSIIGLLGEAFPGETVTTDDIALMDVYIDGKIAELGRRKVYYVQDADQLDDEVLVPLAKIVANAVGPHYRKPFLADVDVREERRLRDIDRSPLSNDVLRTCYI